MENGYALALNKWALDKNIKNEVGLLIILSSLSAEKGYCYASNQYLAKILNITEISVSMKLRKLKEKGYITIDYKKSGFKVESRGVRLKNILTADYKIFEPPIKKNFKYKNTSIKNTSIKNIIPVWFDKKIENEKLTDKEKKEMETLLREFKNETN